MSGATSRGEESGAADGHRHRATLAAPSRLRVVLAAAGLALVAMGVRTLLVVARNLPFAPVAVPAPVWRTTEAALPVAGAAALVATGLASRRSTGRVGLLVAGVFGILGTVAPAATVPAVAGVAVGGATATLGVLARTSTGPSARRWVVASAVLAGLTVSLASAVGLVDGGFRGLGAAVALAGVAATALLVAGDRVAVAAGVATGLAVAAGIAAAPYAAGSALLVGFAVVGTPPLLVAVAVAGATAAAVAAARRGAHATAGGVALLVVGGVPATLPRAMVVVLGVTLVVADTETIAAARRASPGAEVAR